MHSHPLASVLQNGQKLHFLRNFVRVSQTVWSVFCRVYNPADTTRAVTFIEHKKFLSCLSWSDKELVDAYYDDVTVVSPDGFDLRCGMHGQNLMRP